MPVDLITACGTTLQHSWYKIYPSIVRANRLQVRNKRNDEDFTTVTKGSIFTVCNEKDSDGQRA